MLMFYKYGGKQLYYFNTNDGQGELDITKLMGDQALPELEQATIDEEDCESCTI
jgi:hypothetical protein